MKKGFFILIFLGIAGSTAFAQKHHHNPEVLFSIGSKPVYTDEFVFVFDKNNQHKDRPATKSEIDGYLDLFINFKLKVAEAERRGMDTTKAFKEEFDKYHDELRKPYLPESRLNDSLTLLTYKRLQEEVKVSHILVAVGPDASPTDTLAAFNKITQIRTRIDNGEDFGMLATDLSDDPSAKSNRGELGYFTALQMIYPFESAAYSGSVGSVTGPVRTRFGYHLIKIEGRRAASGRVEVSHIMVRTGASHTIEEAQGLITQAYDELQKGAAWDAVCSKYSEDPNTSNEGGRLRPFGLRDLSGVPQFEEQAFYLKSPGEYSKPFQTPFGWHIVRLEGRIPLESFDEMKEQLSRSVMHDDRSTLSMGKLMKMLGQKFGLQEEESVKMELFSKADSALQQARWNPSFKDEDRTLMHLNGKTITLKDFVTYARSNQRPNRQQPQAYLTQLYNSFLQEKLIDAQEQVLLTSNMEYRFLLREYYEGILLFDIMEKEVWTKASEDTVGQYEFYQQHNNNYRYGERIDASFFKCPDHETADSLKMYYDNGDEPGAKEFVRQKSIREEAGLFEKADRKWLQEVPFRPGVFSIEEDGNYYLVRINKLISPEIKPYADARSAVISDYQDQLEADWVRQLKSEFEVSINAKARKIIYRELL